jgi:hypothetical protein
MPNPTNLEAEFVRLLNLISEARQKGDVARADVLTKGAARYLVKVANAKAGGDVAPTSVQEPQPAVLQQQQIQPDNDDTKT